MLPCQIQLELCCSRALNSGCDRCGVLLSITNLAHASGIMSQGDEIHLGTVACVSKGLVNACVPDVGHLSEVLQPNLSRTSINDIMMTACHDANCSASAQHQPQCRQGCCQTISCDRQPLLKPHTHRTHRPCKPVRQFWADSGQYASLQAYKLLGNAAP